jgi:hypothetical protein
LTFEEDPVASEWTLEQLHEAVGQFERECRKAGLAPATVQTYVTRTETFLRWLAGDYVPGQGLAR